ncbi:MAG: 50S ribosomal protein L28 [bacterium]|nr:50S ribosomal protein L28 [bacterium]
MSLRCDICGKESGTGSNVSHSLRHTKRVFKPNIMRVRALVEGKVKRIRVCTSCIRSGKVAKP